jgi:galactokinase
VARVRVVDQQRGDVERVSYGGAVPVARTATAKAPGRVTVLGEHTDYNAGRSLAVATPQRTVIVAAPGAPGMLEVASTACGTASCALDDPSGPSFLILAASLAHAVGCTSAQLRVSGDLPLGVGLSSSASYAVCVALALGIEGGAVEVATACQVAERRAGSDVGLLDQLAILGARPGEVVDLDFAAPDVRTFALHPAIGLTVVDSGERRLVGSSAYATRRAECAAAAAAIGGQLGRATLHDLERMDDELLVRRARHVVTECERVHAARDALRLGDLAGLGQLLDAGHASLRDDFDVSTPRVESARDELAALHGVVGVRMTGAGFGGCLLVAHDPDAAPALPDRWSTRLPGSAGASVSWSS